MLKKKKEKKKKSILRQSRNVIDAGGKRSGGRWVQFAVSQTEL